MSEEIKTVIQQNNNEVIEDKDGLVEWIKGHKKELFLAGVSIVSVVLLALALKNKGEIAALVEKLQASISKTTLPKLTTKNNVGSCNGNVGLAKIIENVEVEDLVTVTPDMINVLPHDVKAHLRVLPSGYHASAEKIATAAENGFNIAGGGYTWVQSYSKGKIA